MAGTSIQLCDFGISTHIKWGLVKETIEIEPHSYGGCDSQKLHYLQFIVCTLVLVYVNSDGDFISG